MKNYLPSPGVHGIPAVAINHPLQDDAGLKGFALRFRLLLPAAWTPKDLGIIAKQIWHGKSIT